MSSCIAFSCQQHPNLGKIWEAIRQHGVQPFREITLGVNPSRSFRIINPELGLGVFPGLDVIVMQAYEDMYSALFTARDGDAEIRARTRLLYIGHPGIGKTLFLLYAFVRCCYEKRPLLLHWGANELCYLPVDDEPRILSDISTGSLESTLHPDTVILCDSNRYVVQPPEQLESVHRLLAVFTSPEAARWEWAEETLFPLAYYVPLPTKHDIAALGQSVGGAAGDRIVELYDLLGPIPRLLLFYKDEGEARLNSDFVSMAKSLTRDLRALDDAANGYIRDEEQLAGFRKFFFMTASSSSTDLQRPPPNLPYKAGTQYHLRVFGRALYERTAPNKDLFSSLSVETVVSDSDDEDDFVFDEAS